MATLTENWVSLIKAHERIILAGITALVIWHFCGTGLNAWVHHDETQQTIQQEKSKELAQQNMQIAAQTAQMLAQVKASNAQVLAEIQKQDEQTKIQQITDQTLPLPDLAKRWVSLVNLSAGDISVSPDDALTISAAGSRATVEQLETIPQLQSDLKGQQQVSASNQGIINQQTAQIQALNATVTQDKETCDARVATEKAKAKRSFWRGTKFGLIVGTVGIEALRILAGHP